MVSVKWLPKTNHGDEDGDCGKRRKRDQAPANGVRRGGVGEEREGCAFIEPVGDAQNVGDDGDGVAHRDVRGDHGLGQAIGSKMMIAEISKSQGKRRGMVKLIWRPPVAAGQGDQWGQCPFP